MCGANDMFSVREKREISDAVLKILQNTNHKELPANGDIKFLLHVEGEASWSWADIRDNTSVKTPSVNYHNEAMDGRK